MAELSSEELSRPVTGLGSSGRDRLDQFPFAGKEPAMAKRLAIGFMSVYFSMLSLGVLAHTFGVGNVSSPLMYYFVWDMFCGWSAHEYRYHFIAEGESGTYYDVTHGPWGDVQLFGNPTRATYDSVGNAFGPIAMNVLKHTQHEPIQCVHIIEEAWPKKYNIPDYLWASRFEEPKEKFSYHTRRMIVNPDSTVVVDQPNYPSWLYAQTVHANPRLQADSRRGKPFYAVNPELRQSAFSYSQGTSDSGIQRTGYSTSE
ncbi:hypothetical protein [Planctopirus ephydatiae]|nr:hypothetical protein [Planctopirus ephydatiae]